MHCNSFRNCDGGDYCQECSHAHFRGEGRDRNGKLWRWEFNPQFGPSFLRKDGEPLARQPIEEDHPAWELFETWLQHHKQKEVTP